jgi:hypothetical protein
VIALEKQGFIYIAPPKTGTLSISRWLRNDYGGKDVAHTHDAIVPLLYAGYIPFISVRNPYDRCISLWWWSCMSPSRSPKCHLYGRSFVKYIRRLIWFRDREDLGHETPRAYMTLSQYAEAVRESTGKIPLPIRFEHQKEDVKALPFFDAAAADLSEGAERSDSPHSAPSVFLSPEEEALVWEYCEQDFKAFGYERVKPDMYISPVETERQVVK